MKRTQFSLFNCYLILSFEIAFLAPHLQRTETNDSSIYYCENISETTTRPGKGKKSKAIPLQAWTGPESSRRLRLPNFKIIGT
jgi:hypothetical protein